MYPARFEYDVPGSLEEALAILAERGDEARVLAGGQSLIPMMKLRFAMPVRARRHQPPARPRPHRPCRRAAAPGRAGPPQRRGRVRPRAAAQPRHGGGRPVDRRPAGPQPRHHRRVAGPCRPRGRLGLGHARLPRRGGGHQRRRRAGHPRGRTDHRHVHHQPPPRRAAHRGAGAGPDPAQRRRLPQARTEGGRLRHRGRRHPAGARRGPDRRCRHRADLGGADQRARPRGRAGARGRGAGRRAVRRGSRRRGPGGEPAQRRPGPAEYKRDVVRVFVRRGLARAAELAGGTAAA